MFIRSFALAGVIGFYAVYRVIRVGAGRGVFVRGQPVEPFRHALTIIDVEHALGIDVEKGMQDLFIGYELFIRFANAYYSWSHQVMTLGLVVAIVLFAPWRDATRWASALLAQLPVAVMIYRFYPLMPPRLLDAEPPWGGRVLQIHRELRPTGIVDTLIEVRGPWTPAPVPLNSFTNQFAAMPSLHCAFAMWVGVVWWQWARGKPWRFVGPLHTALVFLCTVVTGNHFILDAVVGWVIAIALLVLATRVVDRYAGRTDIGPPPVAERQHGSSSRIPSTTTVSQ